MISNVIKRDSDLFGVSQLLDVFESRAAQQKEKSAFIFIEEGETDPKILTYNDLDLNARKIAGRLQLTIEPEERAIVLLPAGLEYISALFGCIYANVVAVPICLPSSKRIEQSMEHLKRSITNTGASIILTSAAVINQAEKMLSDSFYLKKLKWIDISSIEIEHAFNWKRPLPDSSTAAVLQCALPADGFFKEGILSHGNMLSYAGKLQETMGIKAEDILVGLSPLDHGMGLIGNIFGSVYWGTKCVLMSPASFSQNPVRWLKTISQYRATISGGPDTVYASCLEKISPEQMVDIDLSTWSVAFSSAKENQIDAFNRFAEKFKSHGFSPAAFYPHYGLAEDVEQLVEDKKSAVDFSINLLKTPREDQVVEPTEKEENNNIKDDTTIRSASASLEADPKKEIEIRVFRTIADIPKEDWDALTPRATVTLESDHLAAIEKSGINDIVPYYLLILKNNRPVGIAYFSIFNMEMLTLSDTPSSLHKTLRSWYPDFLELKTLECGLISGIGESITCLDDTHLRLALDPVIEQIETTAKAAGVDFYRYS